MNIAIPLGGQIRMVICSSFVIAKRKDTTHYDLSGESFQLTGVTADQVYVFDDSVRCLLSIHAGPALLVRHGCLQVY